MEQLQPVRQAQTGLWCDDETPQFSEEFKELMANSITAEELIEYMNKEIDSWPWKDR
ncbi:hypothetical protein [Candidatus Symbiothrix dinenymphae]|uniref:hypothetical protein n=1 Tax=Candidatus Symbiothrix dinenymphae TaxID=467085 RepID=UPI000A57F8A3|nr:hypothetical protein [Candidatus Symbiothrix dinenymphae]